MPQVGSFVIEVSLTDHSMQYLDVETFKVDPSQSDKIYWIHCDSSEKNSLEKFKDKLNLPTEVVNMTSEENRISKTIESNDFLSLQLQCLHYELDGTQLASNLVIHLTSQYCFTATDLQLPIFEDILKKIHTYMQYAKTPCFVIFILLDSILNLYLEHLYDIEIKAEEMDINTQDNDYDDVVNLKNHVMLVKRHVSAILNILMNTSSRKISVISESCRLSLVNLLQNTPMVVSEADSIRDLLNGTLGRIDNDLMHKVSRTMTILAVVATVFLPPTLIAGIYGMNFVIPEFTWKYGYFFSLSLMFLSGFFMYLFFKIKQWV